MIAPITSRVNRANRPSPPQAPTSDAQDLALGRAVRKAARDYTQRHDLLLRFTTVYTADDINHCRILGNAFLVLESHLIAARDRYLDATVKAINEEGSR